jgi:hypothetical protein
MKLLPWLVAVGICTIGCGQPEKEYPTDRKLLSQISETQFRIKNSGAIPVRMSFGNGIRCSGYSVVDSVGEANPPGPAKQEIIKMAPGVPTTPSSWNPADGDVFIVELTRGTPAKPDTFAQAVYFHIPYGLIRKLGPNEPVVLNATEERVSCSYGRFRSEQDWESVPL